MTIIASAMAATFPMIDISFMMFDRWLLFAIIDLGRGALRLPSPFSSFYSFMKSSIAAMRAMIAVTSSMISLVEGLLPLFFFRFFFAICSPPLTVFIVARRAVFVNNQKLFSFRISNYFYISRVGPFSVLSVLL